MWRPIHPKHAIERVRIVVQFGSPLPTKFLRKLSADGENRRIELGFTSKNIREGNQITFSPVGVSVDAPKTEFGWDWRKLSPANTLTEAFVVEDQAIVYEVLEYTRWGDMVDRFEAVAGAVLEAVCSVVEIRAVSLEYFDRFVYNGEADLASPTLILNGLDGMLPDDVISGKELWHSHRGWFETLRDAKLLVNQNIDAQEGQLPDGKRARSIQVFTKTELRVNEAGFDYPAMRPYLDDMHTRSKLILSSILSDEMIEQIGLKAEVYA